MKYNKTSTQATNEVKKVRQNMGSLDISSQSSTLLKQIYERKNQTKFTKNTHVNEKCSCTIKNIIKNIGRTKFFLNNCISFWDLLIRQQYIKQATKLWLTLGDTIHRGCTFPLATTEWMLDELASRH